MQIRHSKIEISIFADREVDYRYKSWLVAWLRDKKSRIQSDINRERGCIWNPELIYFWAQKVPEQKTELNRKLVYCTQSDTYRDYKQSANY